MLPYLDDTSLTAISVNDISMSDTIWRAPAAIFVVSRPGPPEIDLEDGDGELGRGTRT
jgi:hypothetical protein